MRKLTKIIIILLMIGTAGCGSTTEKLYYPNNLIGESFNVSVQSENLQESSLTIEENEFIFVFDNGEKHKEFSGTFDPTEHVKNGLINYDGKYNTSNEKVTIVSTTPSLDNLMFCVYENDEMLCIGFQSEEGLNNTHGSAKENSNVDINENGKFFLKQK